jgi:hypothetical protein
MRQLDFTNIDNFYKCYQEQIGHSIASNLTDQKIDEICDKAIDTIDYIRNASKYTIQLLKGQPESESNNLPAILMLLLEQNCLNQFLEITENRVRQECGLGYYRQADHTAIPPHYVSNEHLMWAWAVFFMSWTIRNLKGKVEIGHCWNQDHRYSDKMSCPQGSKFHLEFYNDCLQSFKDIIKSAELNPPIPTYYLLSNHYQNNPDQLPKLIQSILKAL